MWGQAQNDPEILAMTNLVSAYQRKAIMEFEKILKVCVFIINSIEPRCDPTVDLLVNTSSS